MLNPKRITIFCGHYGSGKTNIAVNYALWLRSLGKDVAIGDLDIVNPYFRTKDSERLLTSYGVKVISLQFANSSVDLPSLPSEAYSLVQSADRFAVLDIGGDDAGAYALGRYVPYIKREDNYDMLYVVNFLRPLTQSAESAFEVMKEIEGACGLSFTGIVNNTNLGDETTKQIIVNSAEKAEKLSALSGIPVKFTSAEEKHCSEGLFPLKLQPKYYQ